jgi:hypothetical protein
VLQTQIEDHEQFPAIIILEDESMNFLKKCLLALSLSLSLTMSSAFATMLPPAQFSAEPERSQQLANMSQRRHVERQLIELGVEAADARQRVKQMTSAEIAGLQGKLTELPAGGRISTIELLLIIIVIILII